CQIQLHAEALEHIGLDTGFALATTCVLEPGPALEAASWGAIVCTAASVSARLIEAASWPDRRAHAQIPELVARVDNLLTQIRPHSDAPIFLLGISRPELYAPTSWPDFNLAVAECNARLQQLARWRKDVFVVDQEEIASSFSGAYWDDLFTASSHHSAISSWS